MKIAILDDYLDVALGLTDWQQLGSDADIQVFQKPFLMHRKRFQHSGNLE